MDSPMELGKRFPVRKSKKQKEAFRAAVMPWLEALGYSVSIEKGSFGTRNMVIGNPQTAKYLVTAHYDTCARLPFPNLITPCNFLPFLGYQIFLCLVLLVPAVGLGVLVGWVLRSCSIGYFVFLALLWAEILGMVIGPANPTNVNDNTSGVVTLLEIAHSLPEASRKDVCFVLFDLEEAGLIGSSSYQATHKKETTHQLVLNLDCVGEGDDLYFFPSAKVKQDKRQLERLQRLEGNYGTKKLWVRVGGFSFYPSDQMNFPRGVGICALNRSKAGAYLSRIHTPKDTILDENNVTTLYAVLTNLITGCTAQ